MDWSKVKIRNRWGQWAVYDKDWQLLGYSEIEELTNILISLTDDIKAMGGQEEVIDTAWISFLRETIREAIWHFEPPKKIWQPHAGCVYFLRDPQNPTVTKVGYTTELSQRVRVLSGIVTRNDHKLDLIAVAYTAEFKRLEMALHRYLGKFHTEGEWFLSDGVDAVLKEVKQILTQ